MSLVFIAQTACKLHLRGPSVQTNVRAVTLRYKLQINLAIFFSMAFASYTTRSAREINEAVISSFCLQPLKFGRLGRVARPQVLSRSCVVCIAGCAGCNGEPACSRPNGDHTRDTQQPHCLVIILVFLCCSLPTQHAKCICGTDLLRHTIYVPRHWDVRYRSIL